jgi:polyferredoxin
MKKVNIRFLFQVISFIIFLTITFLLIRNTFFIPRSVCPYSVVCFGITSIQANSFIYPLGIIAGFLILLITLFIGRKFCGYICPIGTTQEWIYKINPKARKKRCSNFPKKLHQTLLPLKYIVFIFTIITAILGIHYLYIRFCPIYGISHPQNLTVFSLLTIFGILLLGFFAERFWCRYLCPYAALMNIFLYLGRILHLPRPTLRRNMETCIDCALCSKNCPMLIEIHEKEIIDDVNCIYCERCKEKCPRNNALSFSQKCEKKL